MDRGSATNLIVSTPLGAWAIIADIRSQKCHGDAEDSGDFVEFMPLSGLGNGEAAALLSCYAYDPRTPERPPQYPTKFPRTIRRPASTSTTIPKVGTPAIRPTMKPMLPFGTIPDIHSLVGYAILPCFVIIGR